MVSDRSHSPVGHVDRTALTAIEQRLKSASYIRSTCITVRHGKAILRAQFDLGYFPQGVKDAYYDIRWYTSGDFEIHYQENWSEDREWKRCWDRHPRDGSRTHYHSQPDAGHPPEPAQLPSNYYDVFGTVESETIEHIRNHPRHSSG